MIVLHHTDCGAQTFNKLSAASKEKEEQGVDVGERDFLPFQDIEEGVREDMEILKASL